MQNIQQKFKTSYKLWNQKDKNQVEEFLLSNMFFSKFYQNKKLQQISRICLYRKLDPLEKLILQNNNRPEAIILLSGHVTVKKKEKKLHKVSNTLKEQIQQNLEKIAQKQKRRNENQYLQTFLGELKEFNETLTLNSECSVEAGEDMGAEIIFVPCALYNKLQEQIQNERIQKIKQVLQKFFFRLRKKDLHELSKSNCLFRQFKMNNYIYRVRDRPQQVFILIQGMVKLQKPGFSQQTLKQTLLINVGMIFGERDIKIQERNRSAIACTAHVQVLTIPKNQFLKFAPQAFPEMIFDEAESLLAKKPKQFNDPKTTRSLKASPKRKDQILPSINRVGRFHASSFFQQTSKSDSQEKRQYELFKNSHMLIDMNSKVEKKKKFKLQSFSPQSKQQLSQLIKKQQTKIKHLKELSQFTFDDSLIRL